MRNCLHLLDRITEKYLGKDVADTNPAAIMRPGHAPRAKAPQPVLEFRPVPGRRYLYRKGNPVPTEVRAYVVRRLVAGDIYRVIAANTGISAMTVSKIAREECLQRGKGGPGRIRGEQQKAA